MNISKMVRHAGFVTVCYLAIVLAAYTQPHSIDKVFPVEAGGTLRLSLPTGTVIVEGWEYNEVRVQAEISGSPRFLDRLEFKLDQEENDVVIVMRHRARRWFHRFDAADAKIKMNISVPYQYHARIDISAGTVTIENIDGDAIIKSSAGTITVKDIFGNVDAKTSAGTITATLLKDMGNVSLNTSTGSITIKTPEDFAGQFNLRTGIGRVECSLEHFSGSGKSLQFSLSNGGATVEAKASIGSISVITLR
jgi:DUF4097 and DUF4098 domain-containing protein YvlB